MANIGTLNYSIGGDDSQLQKLLKENHARALALQTTLSKLNIGSGGGNKASSRADAKAWADINRRNQESAAKILLTEEKTKVQREKNAKLASQNTKEYATHINQLGELKQLAGQFVGIYAGISFIKNMALISGEFEKQKVSLQAILRDTVAANKLFNEIQALSVKSPFEFKELVSYTKQLAAFSIPTNELFTTTNKLADLSAGLGVDMNRIILAFGQVRSASVLRGQELRQFTEAGIPLVAELAKKFSELEGNVVTTGEVFEKISNREVSFKMVRDILFEMTDVGGRFYQMQEIQSQTVAGKIANLVDAYDIMLYKMGTETKGAINIGLSALTSMMNNWETFANILIPLIVAMGSYKIAVTAASFAINLVNGQTKIQIALTEIQKIQTLLAADATTTLTASQMALNAAYKANVFALIIALVAALGYGIYKLVTYQTDLEKSQERLNQTIDKSLGAMQSEQVSIKILFDKLKQAKKGSEEYNTVKNEIYSKYGKYLKNLGDENTALDNQAKAYQMIASSAREAAKEKSIATAVGQIDEDLNKSLEVSVSKAREIIEGKYGKNTYKTESAMMQIRDLIYSGASSNRLTKNFKDEMNTAKYGYLLPAIIEQSSERFRQAEQQRKGAEKAIDMMRNRTKAPTETQDLSQWAKNFNDRLSKLNLSETVKESFTIKPDAEQSFSEFRDKIKENFESAEKDYKYALSSGLFGKDISSKLDKKNNLKAIYDLLGITSEESGAPKNEDKYAENLKKRIEVLKNAKQEYESILKSDVSQSDAISIFGGLSSFKGIDPTKIDNMIQGIIDEMKGKGKLTEKQQEILTDLVFGVDKSTVDKKIKDISDLAKKAIDETHNAIKTYEKKFNLYEQILGITGNEEMAQQVAFGVKGNVKSIISVIEEEINRLSNTKGVDPVVIDGLKVDIKNITLDDKEKFDTEIAKLISDFASTEDKIKAKEEQKRKRRIEIKAQYGEDTSLGQIAVAASDNAFDIEIEELKNNLFELTPFFKTLFGDLSDIGVLGLKKISDEAKNTINNAKAVYDTKGNLKGYSYEYTDANGVKQSSTMTPSAFRRVQTQAGSINKGLREGNDFKNLFSKAPNGEALGDTISKKAQAFAGVAKDLGAGASEMFSAFGNEKAADAAGFVGDMAGSVSNIVSGIVSGNPVAVLQGLMSGITAIAQYHDKILERQIKESQAKVKDLQMMADDLTSYIERQLGTATGDQVQTLYRNLLSQRAELIKQKAALEDMNKKDKEAIKDKEREIKESTDRIKYYYEDTFSNSFGINIKNWASEISSSLMAAFQNGESAAEAFDSSVGNIMKSIVGKMIQLNVLEPAMNRLREKLFGQGGVLTDGTLDKADLPLIAKELSSLKGEVGASKELYDGLREIFSSLGISMDSLNGATGTLTAGIKGITEEQASLLTSYINAIRADVSVSRMLMQQVFDVVKNTGSDFANMQAQLLLIQVNTFNTANNTGENVRLVNQIVGLLKNATISGSGTKFNI